MRKVKNGQKFFPPETIKKINTDESAPGSQQYADLGNNDDEAEKKRYFIKSLTLLFGTGVNGPFLNLSARQGAFQLDNLTNGQLADMYSKCVQLSQHGKINQKNAWSLQLVDYINNIIELDEQTNFTKASHTLDAASKIYSSRVDSVHQDIFKTLGTFHQTDASGNENAMPADETAAIHQKEERKLRNRNVGKSTIAASEDAITETLKSLVVKVDPLFHKTATAFDDGGAKGLLMNQLYVQNGCQIVFDGTTLLEQNDLYSLRGSVTEIIQSIESNTKKNVGQSMEERDLEKQWTKELAYRTFGMTREQSKAIVTGESRYSESFNFDQTDLTWAPAAPLCPLLERFEMNIRKLSKDTRLKDYQKELESSGSLLYH
ncbi:hypothetical protein RFI_23297 [Reticulomyxa filosa]|uniref:Condensin complex subunit 2 n=1 Tax=Reticulomyxa filosa TaxID=46433 RepID=X6MJN6_RETFI|nr:hypothetical protein RFI_23297 [Reticulomyxa filosa]|eukprot:ETO14069.1 hypothetical protein RFI_23297 [Reticulomyxa filosa]